MANKRTGWNGNEASLDERSDPFPDDPYPVKCARCGKAGTSATFEIEEGDEWECPECWERCNAQEASQSDRGGVE